MEQRGIGESVLIICLNFESAAVFAGIARVVEVASVGHCVHFAAAHIADAVENVLDWDEQYSVHLSHCVWQCQCDWCGWVDCC